MEEHIKLIIFDLDGTFYDLNDVIGMTFEMQVSFFSRKMQMRRDDVINYFKDNDIFPYITKKSQSATELFLSLGLDKNEWSEYRNAHFDTSVIKKINTIDNNLLEEFSSNAKLVLLSSNSYDSILKILNQVGINKDLFSEIICSDKFPCAHPFNKKLAMQYIADRKKLSFADILSIGDRFNTDIKPMLELGGKGILLHSPRYLRKVLEDMEKHLFSSCTEYEYYTL